MPIMAREEFPIALWNFRVRLGTVTHARSCTVAKILVELWHGCLVLTANDLGRNKAEAS